MPDIDFQRIELNLIPKQGDEPVVFYASQYETTRPFIADLMWGETEFAPGGDCWAEIDIRKNDDNLVVITEDVTIDNNEVSVILPVQALTCIGKNLGQVKIYAGEDQLIAALNFILEVQPDPMAGGVTSETDIDNLTQQIEDIAEEVIGEDYYDKTEVDALLADKADKSELPDMTNYYDKAETDDLLYDKVDYSELNRYYKKLEVDALLANYVETSYLTTNYYSRSDCRYIFVSKGELEIAMQLEGQASGAIATFETAAPEQRLAALKCNFLCSGGNGTPSTPIPLVGHSELNLTRCGANIWNEETEAGVWKIYSGGDGTKGSIAGYIRCSNLIPVKPNTTYHFHREFTNADNRIGFYDINGDYLGFSNTDTMSVNTDKDIITPNGAYFMSFYFTTDGLGNASVNYPATIITYEPYNGQTITLDLNGTRYGGYVDVNNGKLVVTHIGITRTWGDFGNKATLTNNTRGSLNITSEGIGIDNNTSDLCNIAPYQYSWEGDTNHFYIQISGDNTYLYVFLPNGTSDDTVIQVAYELATPIEVDITREYLNSHTGINNVFHDGNGTTEVKYKDTIQHYIDTRL